MLFPFHILVIQENKNFKRSTKINKVKKEQEIDFILFKNVKY
jgi:hypothetical protein